MLIDVIDLNIINYSDNNRCQKKRRKEWKKKGEGMWKLKGKGQQRVG